MKTLKKMLAVFLVIIMLLSPTSINLKKDIFVNAVQFHEGNTIIFGSYPQSEVKDRDLITTLNYLAPSWYEWTSYCYYSGDGSIGSMIQGDWMRYVDIEYSNEKYRGVMFTEYRPYYTYKTSTITYQDDNGYNTDTIYWFKFEPLEWIFLDTMSALVMCKTIVDAQPYCNTIYSAGNGIFDYFNDYSKTIYACDYETSSIREWLNNDFYYTAFSMEERQLIRTKTIENKGYYTSVGTSEFEKLDGNLTNEKIFLLSYDDVKNNEYKFEPDSVKFDAARTAIGSDYAKIQGLYVHNDNESIYNGNSLWSLRTAGNISYSSCYVTHQGCSRSFYGVDYTGCGIRPAFCFSWGLDIDDSVAEKHSNIINPPVPTLFITPKALDGGLGKNNLVRTGIVVSNYGINEYSDKFEIERDIALDLAGSAGGTVTIKADGYRNFIIPNEVLKNVSANSDFNNYYATTAYMHLKKDSGPYISSVYARNKGDTEYTEIRANEIYCDKNNEHDIIVSVDGLADGEVVDNVYILQSSKESFSSKDGVFTDVKLSEKLEQEKTVYVYAVTNKGNQTDLQEVKIDVGANDQFGDGLNNMLTMDFLGNNGQSLKLDTGLPIFSNAEISLDAFKIPVGISRDGDVWRVSVGVDIFTYENEIGDKKKGDWKSFKEQVDEQHKWLNEKPKKGEPKSFKDAVDKFNKVKKKFGDEKEVDKYIKSNKKTDLDFNVGVLGYAEFNFDGYTFTPIAWNGGIVVNFSIEKSIPFSFLGFPCYVGFGGGIDGNANLGKTRQIANSEIPMEFTWVLGIEPFITGKLGAGVDKLLYAEVNGKGSAPTSYVSIDKHLELALELNFSWKAGIWILSANGDIAKFGPKTVINEYFGNASRVVRSFAMDYATKSTSASNNSEPEVSVISRDYAETTSEWLYGEPEISTFALRDYVQQGVTFTDLQQSVFADSKLQAVQVGDDTFATWIEDDTSRDNYNRMRLVYSVRNGDTGLWSEPKAVWDTGVNDGYPSIATDGEKVYIAWQKVNKVITEADCSDATVFFNNGEICLTEYNIATDKIISSEIITDNNYYDYSPVVIINNEEPVVFWTSSADNNMTAMDGCNFNRYSDGTTTILLEGISSPITVSAEVIDGKENISYCTDTDGNFETTDDITVNTYIDGTVTTFDKGENSLAIKDAKYGKLNGESVLFMQDGTNIFYEEDGEIINIFDVDRNIDGNFNIVEAVNGTQLIWTEKDENGSSNIFSCVYSDNVWSDPVKVSENDKYITNLVAVCANGKIIGGCNRTEVTYDEETQTTEKGLTDLSYWSMADFSDIEIELFSYKEKNFIESGSNSFDLHVANSGTTNIDEIEFVIEDTLGNSTTVAKEVNLISGEAQTVEVPYTPSENYAATTLTVTANISNDVDEENNTTSFEVGSSDVAIEVGDVIEDEDCFDISALVSNLSLIDAENVKLSIYANSEENEALKTIDFEEIPSFSMIDSQISIKKEAVTFSESGMGIVYLKLTADKETNVNNNSFCVPLILEKEKECGHPLTETMAGKAPSCMEDGTSDYEVCLVCGENATESESVSARHNYGEWYTLKPATCKETGTEKRECSECGYFETCDVSAIGHSFGDWNISIPAKCEVNGVEQRDCSVCGYSETQEIPAVEHSYEYVVTNPTCTAQGYTTYTCTICGEGYTSDITGVLDHNLGDWYEFTPATCEEEGTEQRDCMECDYTETREIPAMGHKFDGSECKNCDYDKADDCSCNCHKSGISNFFFKIGILFQKIFKKNKVCKCGVFHY